MDFRFNLSQIFKSSISKIDHTLLPSDFPGDRRNAMNCAAQVAEIMDEMGIASAKAQDLQHPITSAEKLRNVDHLVYLLVDLADNKVVGLLKVGMKNLFLFDETGMVHESKSLSILDFYVHESKQRTGLGKKLYDFMLYDHNIEPCKLAIDKPSLTFISFLHKHYGLSKIYPQNNNFVVFEGFFNKKKTSDSPRSERNYDSSGAVHHSHTQHAQDSNHSIQSEEYLPTLFGRHTAYKRGDTMGNEFNGSHARPMVAKNKQEVVGQGSTTANSTPTSGAEYFTNLYGTQTAYHRLDTKGENVDHENIDRHQHTALW